MASFRSRQFILSKQFVKTIVLSFSAALADGALTTVAAKVRRAGDLLTENNYLFPSKPEYFRLHRKREKPQLIH